MKQPYGRHVKCPVCDYGYYTTSGNPNLSNHIVKLAARECFDEFMLGGEREKPHAHYYRKHARTNEKPVLTFKVPKSWWQGGD